MASKCSASHTVADQTPQIMPTQFEWGKPLTQSDYAALEESWISPEIADAAMLRRVDDQQGQEIVGQKGNRHCSGILFSYYWPGDVSPFNHRIRRDRPEWSVSTEGKPKPEGKYLGPPNSGNRLFVPRGVTPEQVA